MRYAVLADIHSNLEALTAVMNSLSSDRIDRYLCLGDIVGYGADPEECITQVQKSEAITVGGNHDLACIGKIDPGWFNQAARTAVLWTRDKLSFTDLDSLRRLPLTATEGPLTLVHGTLRHPQRFEYMVDMAQVLDTMGVCKTLICLVGHTHVPFLVEYDRSLRRMTRIVTEEDKLKAVKFQDKGDTLRYVLNVGAVGQPRDGDSRASFAVIDTDKCTIEIRRVSYDVASTQKKIRDAGLPGFLADRLEVGR